LQTQHTPQQEIKTQGQPNGMNTKHGISINNRKTLADIHIYCFYFTKNGLV